LSREFPVNLMSGVPISIWYDWHDDGADPNEPEYHFGLVRHPCFPDRDPVYDPKPAYFAIQTLVHHLRGWHFTQRLPVASADDFVLVFQQGGQRQFVAWTTDQPHPVTLPEGIGRTTLTGIPQCLAAKSHD
jgi:hypothetical protein